jgi:hypothetical protein
LNAQIRNPSGLSKSTTPSRARKTAAFFMNVRGTMRPSAVWSRSFAAVSLAARAVSMSRTEWMPPRLREP